jgi:putative oxidoreductase
MTIDDPLLHEPAGNTSAEHQRRLPDVWLPPLSWCPTALRWGVALVYVWFGALKLDNNSPVASLVQAAYPFGQPAPAWVVPLLGVTEAIIGLWFLSNRYLNYLFPVFIAHMASTFVVLVSAPSLAFQSHDPLLLTTTGEFVIKNLVLIPAGTAAILLSIRQNERSMAEQA